MSSSDAIVGALLRGEGAALRSLLAMEAGVARELLEAAMERFLSHSDGGSLGALCEGFVELIEVLNPNLGDWEVKLRGLCRRGMICEDAALACFGLLGDLAERDAPGAADALALSLGEAASQDVVVRAIRWAEVPESLIVKAAQVLDRAALGRLWLYGAGNWERAAAGCEAVASTVRGEVLRRSKLFDEAVQVTPVSPQQRWRLIRLGLESGKVAGLVEALLTDGLWDASRHVRIGCIRHVSLNDEVVERLVQIGARGGARRDGGSASAQRRLVCDGV